MTLRDEHHATRERSRDEQCPTIGRKRKKGRTLGAVDVIDREEYAELEVDAKVELIRSLVPLGLMHIEELLDEEVTALAGERYARKAPSVGGRRHGSNPGTVGLAGQRVPIRVPRIRHVTESEIPLRSYEALHGDRAVNDLLLRRVLYGISCRNDAAAAEAIPRAIGLSGSTVSRRGALGRSPAQAPAFSGAHLEGTPYPDLNGIWQAVNTAHWDLEDHVARPGLATVAGPDGDVPAAPVLALGAIGGVPGGQAVVENGSIPYQPWAATERQANLENVLTRDPEVKCFMPGIPRATYMPYPFQIAQSTNRILMIYEFASANRTIYLEDVGPAPVESWMGHSVGRWDGDTLVVDVTDQIADTWFDRAGNFHGSALRVTERYTPISPDHLRYEATIEDPDVFTRTWTISMPLYRRQEPDVQWMEYNCVEFVEELLYGHLRREQLVRRWEGDLGERGGRLIIDITRGPSE